MTYRSVKICFASIMQASAKPCRVFPVFFFCFSCLHRSNLRSPSYVMIMPVHDWSLSAWREYLAFRCITLYSLVLVVLVFSSDTGTELVRIESTIESTRRGGSSR